MENSKDLPIYSKDRFNLILWHIDRYDKLRAFSANRAAMVLSAGALLLAANTFLLDKALSNVAQYSVFEKIVQAFGVGTSIILLILSISQAITGIANVWRTSREMLGKLSTEMPKRLFFHPRDTIEEFEDFRNFFDNYVGTDDEKQIIYALGELWTVTFQHHDRYQKLRKAIRLLVFSIFPMLLSIGVLIVKFF